MNRDLRLTRTLAPAGCTALALTCAALASCSLMEGPWQGGRSRPKEAAPVAEVPELPGCAADGPTHAEALRNVEVVIGEWIETAQTLGRPIPQPKGRLLYA